MKMKAVKKKKRKEKKFLAKYIHKKQIEAYRRSVKHLPFTEFLCRHYESALTEKWFSPSESISDSEESSISEMLSTSEKSDNRSSVVES